MRRLPLPLLALTVLVVAFLMPASASAHGADCALSVIAATPSAVDNSVHYQVRVVYQNDGEPVPGVELLSSVIGSDGAVLGEQPFISAGPAGEYEGSVVFPAAGTWKVRFWVEKPEGTLEIDQIVGSPATTSAAPTTVAETAAEVTLKPPSTEAKSAAATDVDDDSGSSTGLVVGGIVVVAVAAGAVLVLARRRAG